VRFIGIPFIWGAGGACVPTFWRGEQDIAGDRGEFTIAGDRGQFTIDRWRGKDECI
jgi:hypothetical protein